MCCTCGCLDAVPVATAAAVVVAAYAAVVALRRTAVVTHRILTKSWKTESAFLLTDAGVRLVTRLGTQIRNRVTISRAYRHMDRQAMQQLLGLNHMIK